MCLCVYPYLKRKKYYFSKDCPCPKLLYCPSTLKKILFSGMNHGWGIMMEEGKTGRGKKLRKRGLTDIIAMMKIVREKCSFLFLLRMTCCVLRCPFSSFPVIHSPSLLRVIAKCTIHQFRGKREFQGRVYTQLKSLVRTRYHITQLSWMKNKALNRHFQNMPVIIHLWILKLYPLVCNLWGYCHFW